MSETLGYLCIATACATFIVMLWAIAKHKYFYLFIHIPMIAFQLWLAYVNLSRVGP